MKEGPRVVLVICLCIATAIPFLPALGGEFTTWDDNVNVTDNPYISKGVKSGLFPLLRRSYGGLYIPVTYAVYWAQFHVWGLSALGFHLFNQLIHAVNVALMFLIFWRLMQRKFAAALAALWWGVHPLNVEPVAWVTGMKDALSVFWMLLSLFAYICWRDIRSSGTKGRRSGWIWTVSFISFVLSCLSKPGAVAFPLALVGYDWLMSRRKWAGIYVTAPYFLVSALVVLMTMLVQKPEEVCTASLNIFERVRLAGDSFLFYLEKSLLPRNLSPAYGLTADAMLSSPWSWIRLLAIGAFGGLALLIKGRWRFGLPIFFAGIFPVSGLVSFSYQNISTVADRYAYFSTAGVALILGESVLHLAHRAQRNLKGCGALAYAALLVWAILLGVTSWHQTSVWRNSSAIWQQVLRVNPDVPTAYNNLGLIWVTQGNPDKGIVEWTHAIERNPDYDMAYSNRGLALAKKNDYDRAIRDCTRAIEINPNVSTHYHNRGAVFQMMGEYGLAIEDYTRAIRRDPSFAEAYRDRGVAWGVKGDHGREVENYALAIQIKPDYAEAYNDRGLVLVDRGQLDEAIQDYTRAIAADPTMARAYLNRGVARQTKGSHDSAMEDFDSAIKLQPDYSDAYYNRGNIWAARKDYLRAIEDYTYAIKLKPTYAEAYNNRGVAWARKGNTAQAIQDCTRAIELKSEYGEAYNNRAALYYSTGKIEQALNDAQRCLASGGVLSPGLAERLKVVSEQPR